MLIPRPTPRPPRRKLIKRKVRRVRAAARELLLSPGTILAAGLKCLRLTEQHLAKHLFIAGGSGQGKSKLIELICLQLLMQRQGFTFIDPDGDSCKAVLDAAAGLGIDPSDIYYFKPSTDICLAIDLLAGAPTLTRSNAALKLASWIDALADRIIRALLRDHAQADQNIMMRLKHRLRTLIWCCAVRVNGTHLGLSDMRVLLDPRRPEFAAVLERIKPELLRLKPEVYYELEELRETKSATLRNQWMESTGNLLDEKLGIVMQLVFGQHAEPLDFARVISERKILLVDLSDSDDISASQASALGGMIISALINTARRTPKRRRVIHYLIIDEAESFLGEDLRTSFARMRKFKLVVCIAFQDLTCLERGDLDLKQRVIDNCGLWFVFAQADYDTCEYLGRSLKLASLDMTPLLVDAVLPDGYDWVPTCSLNLSVNENSGSSESESASLSHGVSRQRQTAESYNDQVSLALSRSEAEGESGTETENWSVSAARSANWQDTTARTASSSDAASHGTTSQSAHTQSHTQSSNSSAGRSSAESLTDTGALGRPGTVTRGTNSAENRTEASGKATSAGTSHASGVTDSRTLTTTEGRTNSSAEGGSVTGTISHGGARAVGANRTSSAGFGLTLGRGRGRSKSGSHGVSKSLTLARMRARTRGRGSSVGLTFQRTPLSRHRLTKQTNGKTVVAVADQFYGVMKTLAGLPERTVLVKCKGVDAPFLLEVHEVKDPVVTPAGRRRFLQKVYASPCYFLPTDEAHRGTVTRFLGTPVVSGSPLPPAEYEDDENPIG